MKAKAFLILLTYHIYFNRFIGNKEMTEIGWCFLTKVKKQRLWIEE